MSDYQHFYELASSYVDGAFVAVTDLHELPTGDVGPDMERSIQVVKNQLATLLQLHVENNQKEDA